MKKCICFIIIMAAFTVLSDSPLHSAEKEINGERFQLFNAEYNSATIQVSKTTVFLEKRLFKIDNSTGETWMLIDVVKEGKDIKYWQKIKESQGN